MTTKKTASSCLVLVLSLIGLSLSYLGSADAANALYAFGDSFITAGNGNYLEPPWGMTWPGHGAGRASDGRNQVDFFAELFGVPYPVASSQLMNDSQSVLGVNFGQGGAGVTYAYGKIPLDTQVNNMESLVQKKAVSRIHLRNSVALVSLGVNDYSVYNKNDTFKESAYATEVKTVVTTVVDGIALSLMRLYSFGFRNIVIANLASMACSPYITFASNYTSCSSNSSLAYESSTHNALLQQRVRLLKQELRGANFIIVDQTKAFEHLFHHGAQYGFENPLTPCCTGKNDTHVLDVCGHTDSTGQPLYNVCKHPEKALIFDGIHPTQAGWKAVINLYASVPGFTKEGPNLKEWIQRYEV